jgi:hypothetical protein
VASGLNAPMLGTAPNGDGRLFIPERTGAIGILENGLVNPSPFLTISGVSVCGEGGSLGLAFHPDFASNGRFFVHYTVSRGGGLIESRIVEYRADPWSSAADAAPVQTILTVDQPGCNHNAGSIAFGMDGYLYIPFGDGGKQGDPDGNAQSPHAWLGSILRIDIDGGVPYAIPPGNPYNGADGAREVWANGLSNPYRSSFDRATGDLYIGDVGQNAWEEVSVGPVGVAELNVGWSMMEGNACYPPSTGCTTAGLTRPAVVYPDLGQGRSVVGGYVYRGASMPALSGTISMRISSPAGFDRSDSSSTSPPINETGRHRSGPSTPSLGS